MPSNDHDKKHHPYFAESAPFQMWDPDAPTLDSVLTALAAEGVVRACIGYRLLPAHDLEVGGDEWWLARLRWEVNFLTFTGAHNLYLALTELAKHSREDAENVAVQVMAAYDAGDSYGEWLWQWATERGLDADRLIAEYTACPDCGRHLTPDPAAPDA